MKIINISLKVPENIKLKNRSVLVLLTVALMLGQARATINYRQQFLLSESMKIYDFPEELISYQIHFPEETVKKDHLKLTLEGNPEPKVYQLADVREKDGYLVSAELHFRTGLNKGQTKNFIFEHDSKYKAGFDEQISIEKPGDGTVTISADRLSITLPYGMHSLTDAKAEDVMAPLLSIGREKGNVAATGRWQDDGKDSFVSLSGEILEKGPLFVRYRVNYKFAGGGFYQVDLTLQHHESHVLIDELMDHLKHARGLSFVLDYTEGVNPDGRLAYTMHGYGRLSGAYDRGLREDGSLPLYMGLWDVHNTDVPYSIAFWNDHGKPDNAILFSQYRHNEWVADTHYIWSIQDAPEQLHFYQKNNEKYMQVQLAGRERHWAIGVIPRDEVVIRGNSGSELTQQSVPPARSYKVYSDLGDHGQGAYPPGGRDEFGSGPEVKLHQKLTYFSLDWVKDMVFEVKEPLSKYNPDGKAYSYDEYWHKGEDQSSWHYKKTVKTIADMGLARTGRAQFRTGDVYRYYANSRAGWTQEQRDHIRSLLIWTTHVEESDVMYPHRALMGGHPNFIANAKYGMAYACALWPEHPYAPEWKSEYLWFLDTFLDDYIRRGVPEMGIKKGRFMENPANYMPASLIRKYEAFDALHRYDGTDLFRDERFRSWMQWTLHALMPYVHEGEAVMPSPIGAHAVISRWNLIDDGEDHYGAVYRVAEFMHKQGDELGSKLLYVLTNGEEGIKPNRESHVWGDYGGVLHYDADGPDHAFVHLFQRGSTLGYGNYRYPPHDAGGALYYASNGRTWSWNGGEKFGDAFNPRRVNFFRTRGGFLGGLENAGQHGFLCNFGDVQYYKATGSPDGIQNGYLSRAVMMVRDDYIAVYDDLDKPEREGMFQWINEEDGLKQAIYEDTEFENRVHAFINGERFPADCEWGDGAPVKGMDGDRFSVRWEGAITSARGLTGDYTFTLEVREGSRDKARLYIDNELILEATGEDAETTYRLVDGTRHPFKLEYVHMEGQADFRMRFSHPEDKNTSYQARGYTVQQPMPDIHTIKGKVNEWTAGDQLHVVAPGNAPVSASAFEKGAIVDGAYVFFSGRDHRYDKDEVTFHGTAGYAAEGEMAIFEGSRVGYGDMAIEVVGGKFSASAKRKSGEVIEGRFAGESGGILRVKVPGDFGTRGKKVVIDGETVPFELQGNTFVFPVSISRKDGHRTYVIFL